MILKPDKNSIHTVNKCIAIKLFSDELFICYTIEHFVNRLLPMKNTTFIAHNGKAYDTWITHKYLIKNTNTRPSKIRLCGQEIMYMKIKSLRFIFSLNHIAQPLASFLATFGLDELKRGFYSIHLICLKILII